MRYVQGQNREQTTLFPSTVDDYITDDNPVRFIDAFVADLDLVELGCTYSQPKETGRKAYNPADMLKLYLYGYLNRIRSSRRLEAETHKNVELMWLLRMLRPDFKTIADFRKDNKKAIKNVCREFTLLCRKLDLFGLELFGIDGSKFSAVNHNQKAFTKEKLKKLLERIDKKIDDYVNTLEQGDEAEKQIEKPAADQIEQNIKDLKERKHRYQSYQKQLDETEESQIVLTDPTSRLMRTGHDGRDVCYNAQFAIDNKFKLIGAHAVTSDGNDMHQLSNMCDKIKTTFGLQKFKAAADTGYFQRDEIKKCHDNGVDCYVPEPKTSKNYKLGKFTNKDFQYDAAHDCYTCPAGEKLKPGSKRRARMDVSYATSACKTCRLKSKCTTSKRSRRIYRWEHQDILEQMEQKLKQNPQYMDERRNIAEHPFGTMKHAFGFTHFLCKGLDMVNTEMNLSVIAYNMRRVINIVGVKELMSALA